MPRGRPKSYRMGGRVRPKKMSVVAEFVDLGEDDNGL